MDGLMGVGLRGGKPFFLCNIEHDRSPEPLTTGIRITENG